MKHKTSMVFLVPVYCLEPVKLRKNLPVINELMHIIKKYNNQIIYSTFPIHLSASQTFYNALEV